MTDEELREMLSKEMNQIPMVLWNSVDVVFDAALSAMRRVADKVRADARAANSPSHWMPLPEPPDAMPGKDGAA